jgi:acetyltransferase-like isoleucine patch superfamily enzyme
MNPRMHRVVNSALPMDRPASIRISKSVRSGFQIYAKRLVQALFGIWVLPRLVTLALVRMIIRDDAFRYSSESIARIPGLRGVYQRQAFYRRTLSRCGHDVYFGWESVFSMTEATVGDRAYIGRFCSIGYAEIGAEVMLADHVQILSGGQEHGRSDRNISMHDQDQTYRCVCIGRGTWIGAGAIIMADVGENSIIGAGAVVTRAISANCIAVGVPARVIEPKNNVNEPVMCRQPDGQHAPRTTTLNPERTS